MTRLTLLGGLVLAVGGPGRASEPVPQPASTPVELVLINGDKPARVELGAEVDGTPVSAIWAETFTKLFAYFDRNADGALDAKEVALLPPPRALRLAMGNGFTPPVGPAPAPADIDRNGDGKVTPDELAAFYRAAGVGNVQIGVGRLPASADLTAALLKTLDTNGDGAVSENEWRVAGDALKKLDKNDDELIGAGELVPKAVYPGAAGTVLLAPPSTDTLPPDVLAKLPLVLLSTDPKDTTWAAEIERRNPRIKAGELPAWRKHDPDARWVVRFTEKPATGGRFTFTGGSLRVDGWLASGNVNEALTAARKQVISQFEGAEPEEPKKTRRRGGELAWLIPIADQNADGKLDRKELDAWLDLQAQIARGQVLLTVLDGAGLFELLDLNHDGALSLRELRGAWDRLKETGCVTAGAYDPKKLPRVVLAAASRGYPQTLAINARRGPAWFRAMDRNGDGDLSRREFTGPADVFDKLDLDKDGLLSAEEAEKADIKK